MASRSSVAASVAKQKAAHPEMYCPTARCLWRTGGGACPRHGGKSGRAAELAALRSRSRESLIDESNELRRQMYSDGGGNTAAWLAHPLYSRLSDVCRAIEGRL